MRNFCIYSTSRKSNVKWIWKNAAQCRRLRPQIIHSAFRSANERRRKLISHNIHLPNPIRFLIFLSTFILFLIGENKFSAFLLLFPHWHKLPHTSFLLDTPMNDLLIHQKNKITQFNRHAGIEFIDVLSLFFTRVCYSSITLIHLRRCDITFPKLNPFAKKYYNFFAHSTIFETFLFARDNIYFYIF